jgi:hypothetical protein
MLNLRGGTRDREYFFIFLLFQTIEVNVERASAFQ